MSIMRFFAGGSSSPRWPAKAKGLAALQNDVERAPECQKEKRARRRIEKFCGGFSCV